MSHRKSGSDAGPPQYREDDSWFSEKQLAGLSPADHADALHAPIPTQMVSNGEYVPMPQTLKQKRVEARMLEISDRAAKKMNMGRRSFLKTSGGMAAGFIAMNEVFGRFFDVHLDELFISKASAATELGVGSPLDLFVFDDQLHIIRASLQGPGNALRGISAGAHTNFNPLDLPDELNGVNMPWNPALVGLPNLNSNFHFVQFMKDVYLDSQVSVAVMTNNNSAAVPGEGASRPPKNVAESEANEFLTARQTMATRDFVNLIAGSTRMLGHGQLYTGIGNLWFIQQQIDELHPDSWKGYTVATAAKVDSDPNSDMRRWRLDDEAVAYPTYELISRNRRELKKHPGFFTMCIHKGLNTTAGPIAELGHPSDIPKAARDWPEFTFIIYHACFRPSFWALSALEEVRSGVLRQGVPDISWTTEFAILAAPFPNVQAELGTTFASTVITFPTVCAHILGQLLKFLGEDRIVFGSDGVWYGAPQWQIEAFWRFQIPEELCVKYGYPQLTEIAKRKILGLTSARNYRLPTTGIGLPNSPYKPVPSNYEALMTTELKTILEYPGYIADNMSKMKEVYLASGGRPDHTRYGWMAKRG